MTKTLTQLWQIVREDDNGVVYFLEGPMPEDDAREKAKTIDDANRAKPHPHKQSYFAEPQQDRLRP